MMHRSRKLLCSGDEEYFNEKRSVNVRVDGTAHLAEIFPAPKGADEYQPSRWFCPSVGNSSPIPLGKSCS
jgi:hypothetical protein